MTTTAITTPPMQDFCDPAYMDMLARFWRPAPPYPFASGYTAGANGQDHPTYPESIRRIARRLRDGRTLEALT